MSKLLKKMRISYLFAGVLALCLSSLSVAGSPTLDRVVEAGVLKVGMSGDQPPFNTVSRAGPVIGFDVDMAGAMAAAMKVDLQIVEMPFGELMSAMQDGKVDMIMSGMAITPSRTQGASFVGPYMISGKSMLTTGATMAKVSTAGDFNSDGMTLVALENSTSAEFVTRNMPNAKLKTIPNYDTGIDMLLAGGADAMVADMPICKLSVLRYPNHGLVTLEEPMTVEPVGIAVSSDDTQFQNLVRNYLSTFEKMGMTGKLRQKWFESSAWIAALP